jgi:hypothetical protein
MDEGGHWHNAAELYVSKVGEVFFYQLLDVYLGSVKALCNIVLLQLDKHEEMEKTNKWAHLRARLPRFVFGPHLFEVK